MFWLCTNATIDWEAISAVGTAGAAIVALLVWLSDRCSKWAQRNADARLVATILAPSVETLKVRLAGIYNTLWDSAPPRSCPTNEERYLQATAKSAFIGDLRRSLPAHAEELSKTKAIEAYAQQLTALPPATIDLIAITLGHLITAKDIIDEIVRDPSSDGLRFTERVHKYYETVLAAQSSSSRALEQLSAIAAKGY